jgi:predicted TIM-barrel fold metal-dependent hydrolase
MIIDTHAHIFIHMKGETGSGPTRSAGYGLVTLGNRTIRLLPPLSEETTYTLEMLLHSMDWAGVDKVVLLQGPFYGDWNDYVAEAVKRHPDRLVGAAHLDPWATGFRDSLIKILDSGSYNAVKLECTPDTGLLSLHPQATLDADEVITLCEALQKNGLTLVFDLGSVGSPSYQTGNIRKIAQAFPSLKIVIAHLGQLKPDVEAIPAAFRLWEEQIDLGRLPNVWFDCAALPAYLPEEDYPFPTAGRYIQMAVGRIGPRKVMWGTDQPGLLQHASLPQLVKMGMLHTSFLNPDDQALVLGKNALNAYSIKA